MCSSYMSSLFLLCRGDQIHIGFIGHIFQPMGDFGPEALGDGNANDHHVFEDGCTLIHYINNPEELHEACVGQADDAQRVLDFHREEAEKVRLKDGIDCPQNHHTGNDADFTDEPVQAHAAVPFVIFPGPQGPEEHVRCDADHDDPEDGVVPKTGSVTDEERIGSHF